jgi:hypothetical protein
MNTAKYDTGREHDRDRLAGTDVGRREAGRNRTGAVTQPRVAERRFRHRRVVAEHPHMHPIGVDGRMPFECVDESPDIEWQLGRRSAPPLCLRGCPSRKDGRRSQHTLDKVARRLRVDEEIIRE